LRREKQEIRDAIWRALQERAPHPQPDHQRPGLCRSSQLSGQTMPPLQFPSPRPSPEGEGESSAAGRWIWRQLSQPTEG
jgi:hypothetical protein